MKTRADFYLAFGVIGLITLFLFLFHLDHGKKINGNKPPQVNISRLKHNEILHNSEENSLHASKRHLFESEKSKAKDLNDKRLESKAILENAADFYRYIERKKSKLSNKDDFLFRQLGSLQRIFFERDWIFASYVDPLLKGEAAKEAFKDFSALPDHVDLDGFLNRYSREEPKSDHSPTVLKDFLQARLSGSDPGFKNVFENLEAIISSQESLFTSDILPDAWSYATLRNEINDLWSMESESIQQLSQTMKREIDEYGINVSEEHTQKIAEFDRRYVESLRSRMEEALQVYDEIFSWRFQHIHSVQDVEQLLDILAKVELRNVMEKDLTLPIP